MFCIRKHNVVLNVAVVVVVVVVVDINQGVNLSQTGILSGIAVDFIGRHLFVANQLDGEIYVMTLDGRYKKTIVSGVTNLGRIAVNPNLG